MAGHDVDWIRRSRLARRGRDVLLWRHGSVLRTINMPLTLSWRRAVTMPWDNGWHDGRGGWGWLVMLMVMVPFWVGVVWLIMSAVRPGGLNRSSVPPTPPVLASGPEDVLHDRFARGEIEVEEYHHRLDAMRAKRPV